MAVEVTKTGGCEATISWEPADDPQGILARAVESDQLAYALELLAGGVEPERYDAQAGLDAARWATDLSRRLQVAAALAVVRLRDVHGLSWPAIASTVHGDPAKQSSVRRQYEAGRRQLGN